MKNNILWCMRKFDIYALLLYALVDSINIRKRELNNMYKTIKTITFIIITALASIAALSIKAEATTPFGGYHTGETHQNASTTLYEHHNFGLMFREAAYRKPAGSILENEIGEDEFIDNRTGELILKKTDLILSGMGGFDFSLERFYSNRNAMVDRPVVYSNQNMSYQTVTVAVSIGGIASGEIVIPRGIVKELANTIIGFGIGDYRITEIKTGTTTAAKNYQTESHRSSLNGPYEIGVGWTFDLPWVETAFDQSDNISTNLHLYSYLHMGSTGTWKIDVTSSATGLENYNTLDVLFRKAMNNDIAMNGNAEFAFQEKNGNITLFDITGRIIEKRDEYNNKITFAYNNGGHLSVITDSAGRQINFIYSGTSLEKVFVQDPNYPAITAAPEEPVKQKKMEVNYTIQNKTFTLKRYNYQNNTTANVTNNYPVLKEVKIGDETEKYQYSSENSDSTNAAVAAVNIPCEQNKTYKGVEVGNNAKTMLYYNLLSTQISTEIDDEIFDDAKTIYNYQKKTKNCGLEGVMQYYEVYMTYEKDDDEEVNKMFYTKHSNNNNFNYDGFPNNVQQHNYYVYIYKEDDSINNIKHYNYSLYIYNTNGTLKSESNYRSNGINLNSGEISDKTVYEYNNQGDVIDLKNYTYDETNKNNYTVTHEEFEYDIYRNVIKHVSPEGSGLTGAAKDMFTETTLYYNTVNSNQPGTVNTNIRGTDTIESRTYYREVEKTNGVYSGKAMKEINGYTRPNGASAEWIYRTDTLQEKINNVWTDLKITECTMHKGNTKLEKQYLEYPINTDKHVTSISNYDNLGNLIEEATISSLPIGSGTPSPSQTSTTTGQWTYDYFGNVLEEIDGNGIVEVNRYNIDTGELEETISAKGEDQQTKDKFTVKVVDGIKEETTEDQNGNKTVTKYDNHENTKEVWDDIAGTVTEYRYEYEEGFSWTQTDKDLLKEERVYSLLQGRIKGSLLNKTETNYDENDEVKSVLTTNDKGIKTSWVLYRNAFSKKPGENIYQSINAVMNAKTSAYYKNAGYNDVNPADIITIEYSVSETDENGLTIVQKQGTEKGNEQHIVETEPSYYLDGVLKSETKKTKLLNTSTYSEKTQTTTYGYDNMGNVQTTIVSKPNINESIQSRKEYNPLGWVVKEYDDKGWTSSPKYCTAYEYYASGDVKKATIPLTSSQNMITEYEYDLNGNVLKETKGETTGQKEITEYEYDAKNQLIMVTQYPESNTTDKKITQYLYDPYGNKIRMYTGLNAPLNISTSEYIAEQAVTISFPSISGTSYMFYGLLVTPGSDSDYNETMYAYNYKGQLMSFRDPEGRTETYTYKEDGSPDTTVDKNGTQTVNSYDSHNRLDTVTAASVDNKSIINTFQYNTADGSLTGKDNVSYTYNILGQVIQEIETNTKNEPVKKTYKYNAYGDPEEMNIFINNSLKLKLTYHYDEFDRLTEVKDGNGTTVIEYTAWDANGNVTNENRGIYTTETTYNYANQPLTRVNRNNNSLAISTEINTTNDRGKIGTNILSYNKGGIITGASRTYLYNGLGQLTQEERTVSSITNTKNFTYDDSGNRGILTENNTNRTYEYNKNDELLKDYITTNGTENATEYHYDLNGNELASVNAVIETSTAAQDEFDVGIADTGEDNTYQQYDALNRLVKIKKGSKRISYEYNADGLRKSKTVNGVKTIYIWNGDDIVMELNSSYNVKKRYVRGTDLVYSDSGAGTKKKYYVYNGRGDVIQLVASSGAVIKNYEYDAFGNEVITDDYDNAEFVYVSDLEFESETGSYGNAIIDKSCYSDTLIINGQAYEKGLGAHANSEITINLDGKYKRFVSDIGLNVTGINGSVIYKVIADGEEIYNSGVMTYNMVKQIDVSVEGKDTLQLVVDNNGDFGWDQANWADTKLIAEDAEDTNPWRYCGEYYCLSGGFYYLRARMYNTGIGRFTSRDSYTGEEDDPLSLNLYTYCHNDAVNMIDPTGHYGENIRWRKKYQEETWKHLNCFGYALGIDEDLQVPNLESENSVTKVYNEVQNYIKKNHKNKVLPLGTQFKKYKRNKVKYKKYFIIAMRVGSYKVKKNGDYKKNKNGKRVFKKGWDCHFMVRHKNGKWSHKTHDETSKKLGKKNPTNASWDRDKYTWNPKTKKDEATKQKNFYNSKTMYLAIQIKEKYPK